MQTFYLILINLIVVFVGLFIHGDPPKHYYLTIYPIPIILAALYLSKLKFKILVVVLVVVSLINFINFKNLYKLNSDVVPFNKQIDLVDNIVKDANGQKFALKRVGENDKFENYFSDNYIYLFKIRGINIDQNAKLKYTIYENDANNPYFKKE